MAEQRYRVIERLEAGGMAEVFVGEAQSVQGFKKKVAIKRVLPHLAQNKSFISMFLDEARLGARLNHANIVTVFDIGAADNTYFIVMEFVDGVNLKSIIETLRRHGRRFPLKEALYICMEACRGLSYAHEAIDDESKEIGIVHRDVSPPNLLISKRGEVKVTDFGLAKAATQLEKTDPGVVKGKFSYLSPEAALGQDVDARADVFAMGIVLWEMLAGRRLFLGETDYQTVKLVQQANIPSIQRLNPEVDQELEDLLLKSLSRDPHERFQSARELGDALAGYLFRHQLKVTSYDIANLVKSCLSEKLEKPKDQQQSIIDKLIQEELLRFTSLDDMSDPLTRSQASPDDIEGAMPLDAGSFENPAEWFSDDADVNAAFDTAKEGSNPGWLESGLESDPDLVPKPQANAGDLAALLESEDLGGELSREGAAPLEDRAMMAADRSSAPRISVPDHAPPATSYPPEKGGAGAWKFVLILLVLAGAGAAAYFAGVIPQ